MTEQERKRLSSRVLREWDSAPKAEFHKEQEEAKREIEALRRRIEVMISKL